MSLQRRVSLLEAQQTYVGVRPWLCTCLCSANTDQETSRRASQPLKDVEFDFRPPRPSDSFRKVVTLRKSVQTRGERSGDNSGRARTPSSQRGEEEGEGRQSTVAAKMPIRTALATRDFTPREMVSKLDES